MLMSGDMLAVHLALIAVYQWRLVENPDLRSLLDATASSNVRMFIILLNAIFFFCFAANGLYTLKRGASRVDEIFKVVVAVSLAMFIGLVVNTLLPLTQ